MVTISKLWCALALLSCVACGSSFNAADAADAGSGGQAMVAGASSAGAAGASVGGSRSSGAGGASGGAAELGGGGASAGEGSSRAGAGSSAGAHAGGAGGTVGVGGTAAGAGGGGATAGVTSMAGAGGAAVVEPKRITIIGVFGGMTAIGAHAAPPAGSQYKWPDASVPEWTGFEDGSSLGPSAVTSDPSYITAGPELEIGSDAKVSIPEAGFVAIVKLCGTGQTIDNSNMLIADWAEPDNTTAPHGPLMAEYIVQMLETERQLKDKYSTKDFRFVNVMLLGEYDAQQLTSPAATIEAQLRAVNARLAAGLPGSITVASEPNAALTAWLPENAAVREAFEAVSHDGNFYLVNADAIPPANAAAQDPAYDIGQLLNLGSRLEYGIEHQIEAMWSAP